MKRSLPWEGDSSECRWHEHRHILEAASRASPEPEGEGASGFKGKRDSHEGDREGHDSLASLRITGRPGDLELAASLWYPGDSGLRTGLRDGLVTVGTGHWRQWASARGQAGERKQRENALQSLTYRLRGEPQRPPLGHPEGDGWGLLNTQHQQQTTLDTFLLRSQAGFWGSSREGLRRHRFCICTRRLLATKETHRKSFPPPRSLTA